MFLVANYLKHVKFNMLYILIGTFCHCAGSL